jgi:hypothetical protein
MDPRERARLILDTLSEEDLDDLARILDDPLLKAIEEEEVIREGAAREKEGPDMVPFIDEIEILN